MPEPSGPLPVDVPPPPPRRVVPLAAVVLSRDAVRLRRVIAREAAALEAGPER